MFPELVRMRTRQARGTIGGDEGKTSVIHQSASELRLEFVSSVNGRMARRELQAMGQRRKEFGEKR